MNPYEFVKMEQWLSERGIWDATVAYTKSGEIYITFDVRKSSEREFPMFSEGCRVGILAGVSMERYKMYRTAIELIDGRKVRNITSCNYQIVSDFKTYKFNI